MIGSFGHNSLLDELEKQIEKEIAYHAEFVISGNHQELGSYKWEAGMIAGLRKAQELMDKLRNPDESTPQG